MRNGSILAIALAGSAILSSPVVAQNGYTPLHSAPAQANAPEYRYAVTPDAGPWLICVQVFKCDNARELAESMAAFIMREYKVPAYLYEGNSKERAAERQRVDKLRKEYDEFVRSMLRANPQNVPQPFRIRTMQFPEEYAVLIGHPKGVLLDMDHARQFLNDVRKFKAPPKEFCLRMLLGPAPQPQARVGPAKKEPILDDSSLNPFETAFVAPNMTISRAKPPETDIYPVVQRLTEGEEYNLLKCSKPYTLVVQAYPGSSTVLDRNNTAPAIGKVANDAKLGDSLNGAALRARALAEFLRKMKPSYESFVMHTQYYSMVTVGQFDSPDDPALRAAQNSLRGMKLWSSDKGIAFDTLMPDPAVMLIPRPKK